MVHELENILNTYGPTVYRIALSRVCNADTAQDIYQETFLLLLEKKPHFKNSAELRAWLIRTAIKLSASHRKRFDNSKTVPLENAPESFVTNDLTFELISLISTIPESLREVTVLYYIEDMSIKEIAKILSLTPAAVKMRLTRARAELSKIYKEEIL